MSRSPYAVTSALVVACPRCGALAGMQCFRSDMRKPGSMARKIKCCNERRRLADEQRTREVNPEVIKP